MSGWSGDILQINQWVMSGDDLTEAGEVELNAAGPFKADGKKRGEREQVRETGQRMVVRKIRTRQERP